MCVTLDQYNFLYSKLYHLDMINVCAPRNHSCPKMPATSSIDVVPWSPHSFAVRVIAAAPVYRWPAFRAYNKLLKLTNRHRRTRTFYGAEIECDIADLIMMCIYHFGVWEPHIS